MSVSLYIVLSIGITFLWGPVKSLCLDFALIDWILCRIIR